MEASRCTYGKEVVSMPLTQDQKSELIAKFGENDKDTGSTKVQVALLTQRITELTEHMKIHSHDHHSRRGLLKMVGRRRRLLTYMQRHDLEGYRALIKELGLRR
jgi:small subunit ribosomal protein S15